MFFLLITSILCFQIHATIIINDNNEMSDVDFGDILHELLFTQQDQFYHQQLRRASLRYYLHVLYEKKPVLNQINCWSK